MLGEGPDVEVDKPFFDQLQSISFFVRVLIFSTSILGQPHPKIYMPITQKNKQTCSYDIYRNQRLQLPDWLQRLLEENEL